MDFSEFLSQAVREHFALNFINGDPCFPCDHGHPRPQQHGAGDVVSLYANLAALAFLNTGQPVTAHKTVNGIVAETIAVVSKVCHRYRSSALKAGTGSNLSG